MSFLLKFTRVVDAVSEWLGKAANLFVLATIAVGFYNVAGRYVGRFVGQRLTSNLAIELQWYLYAMIYFLAFAYILKHNVNVRVDIFYVNWSPKRRALVDIFGTLLFLIPFCIIGIYATINPVMQSLGRLPNGTFGVWEMSPDPDGLPRAPLKTMIIVAFATLLIASISHAIKSFAIIRDRKSVV